MTCVMITWSIITMLKRTARFTEAVAEKCSVRNIVLKNFTKFIGKYLRWSLFLIRFRPAPATLIKRDSSRSVLCEFCETFKNNFFHKTPPMTASGFVLKYI